MTDKTEYLFDDRIFNNKFSCDLDKCKGACCTVKGTLGAPIDETEIPIIEKNKFFTYKYLSDENIRVIEKEGFYIKYNEKYYLNNINDADCVFSYYENEIAKCSFQKSYNDGKINFKKPISCELFPIRIINDNELRYEKVSSCSDAIILGEEKNITIFEYLKDALIRKFGKSFYNVNIKKRYN